MLKHWMELTLFLREPSAPLDNNICYAARGITNVMPTPRLCRVGGPRPAFKRANRILELVDAA